VCLHHRDPSGSHVQGSNIYMYFTVYNTTYVYQRFDEISITSGLHVSAVKQPSSGQCRTHTRYNISVHSMGSHIFYNKVKIIERPIAQ